MLASSGFKLSSVLGTSKGNATTIKSNNNNIKLNQNNTTKSSFSFKPRFIHSQKKNLVSLDARKTFLIPSQFLYNQNTHGK